MRRELSHLSFSRPTDLAGFRELLAALGLNVDAPAAALAFVCATPATSCCKSNNCSIASREIAGALGGSSDSFLRTLRGDLLLICAPRVARRPCV